MFPDGVNVEWVTVLERDHLRQRTWERGVGETPACGTGAAAAALAAHHLDLTGDEVTVSLIGGDLTLSLRAASDGLHAWQRGPAVRVFTALWSAP